MAKRKAVAYLRFNKGVNQNEKEAATKKLLKFIAAKKTLQLDDIYIDEDVTARQKKPNFERLVADAEKGKFKTVITATKGKIAADEKELAEYVARLQACGCELIEAATGKVLTE